MNLHDLTASQLADAVRRRETSAVQATRAALDRIAAVDPKVRAFNEVDAEGALARAAEVDADLAGGRPVGPLAGVPVALKDNLCTRRGRTTCSSRILGNFRAPYDAHVVTLLQRAGAVVVGKTNLDEFAMGSSTENSGTHTTRNPWDLQRVPGGSSGGSAAAVAGGMAWASLGSDTGGSIRQPAALCGLVGVKPTYGTVSRRGLVAFASSLDQIGPFTRDVRDAALMLDVISGHDPGDSTSIPGRTVDHRAELDVPIKGLRIGLPREYTGPGVDPQVAAAVARAVEVWKSQGASVVEVGLPHSAYCIAVYYIIATAEASSNLARYDGVHYGHRTAAATDLVDMVAGSRAEGFGAEVKRRIMLGTFCLSKGYGEKFYNKACQVRRLIKNDFDAAFAVCDVVAGPTSPTPAFKIGEKADDPLSMYLSDIFTIAANLAGIPSLSVNCGFTTGERPLPIGLQLTGPTLTEAKLLRVARMFESATTHHGRLPVV